jgi:ankyrin repeat protein
MSIQANIVSACIYGVILLPTLAQAEDFTPAYLYQQTPLVFKEKEKVEIEPKYSLHANGIQYDQANTGTCYLHAAANVLSYFYSASIRKFTELSLFDLYVHDAKSNRALSGGFDVPVLMNLRTASIETRKSFTVVQAARFSFFSEQLDFSDEVGSIDRLSLWITKNLSPNVAFLQRMSRWAIKQVIKKHWNPNQNKKLFALEVLSDLANTVKQGKPEPVPPFNVYIFENSSEFKKQVDQVSREEQISNSEASFEILKEKVRQYLEYPIAYSFCAEGTPERCTGRHAVVITGARKACYRTLFPIGVKCDEEWHIVNSYGGHFQGWVNARPLASAFIEKSSISTVRLCDLTGPNRCVPYPLGNANPIEHLAKARNIEGIQQLHNNTHQYQRVNERDAGGRNALHFAVSEEGNGETITALLNLGADVNAINPANGHTPFTYALDVENYEAAELLFQHETLDVNKVVNGETLLHHAAKNGNSKIVEMLLDRRAHGEAKAAKNYTPLHLSVLNRNMSSFEILRGRVRSINSRDSLGRTALHMAVEQNQPEMVRMLLNDYKYQESADPNITTHAGETPLFRAIALGRLELAQILLEKKADPNLRNASGFSPLQKAVHLGQTEGVALLIRQGAKIDAQLPNGIALVTFAKMKGHTEIVRLLEK